MTVKDFGHYRFWFHLPNYRINHLPNLLVEIVLQHDEQSDP
jgi:hypothetical protein